VFIAKRLNRKRQEIWFFKILWCKKPRETRKKKKTSMLSSPRMDWRWKV